jgi:hypothetical protein
MRSPADPAAGPAPLGERLLRAASLLLLAGLLVRELRPGEAPAAARVSGASLGGALSGFTWDAAPARLHLHLDGGLPAYQRDWLAALAGAGTPVTWEGGGPDAVGLAADPAADPAGGTLAWVAGPTSSRLLLEDGLGSLDSLRPRGEGARLRIRSASARLRLVGGSTRAESEVRDSLRLGRVLLLGRAGWEAKFVAAALEERGWRIDARMALSPRGDVRQGAVPGIDTARYSAVIVLDSSPAEARLLAGYLRAGGGLILSAAAARSPGLAALAAGAPGELVPAREVFDTVGADPRASLGLHSLRIRDDAVILERRGGLVAVAARRLERGRVITLGYEDTWRWRMGGPASGMEDHRDWWADLVGGVAYTGEISRAVGATSDEAPRAAFFSRLGPPAAGPLDSSARRVPLAVWFAALLATLLLEWGLRRWRGAP